MRLTNRSKIQCITYALAQTTREAKGNNRTSHVASLFLHPCEMCHFAECDAHATRIWQPHFCVCQGSAPNFHHSDLCPTGDAAGGQGCHLPRTACHLCLVRCYWDNRQPTGPHPVRPPSLERNTPFLRHNFPFVATGCLVQASAVLLNSSPFHQPVQHLTHLNNPSPVSPLEIRRFTAPQFVQT